VDLDFDKKKFSCKFDYCIGKVADLSDPSLHVKAQDYKRRASGEMRAVAGEEAFKLPKAKGYFVSRKYDGEFALVFFDGKTVISVNPGGTVRVGLPCYEELETQLKKAKVASCVLAGELYIREGASKAHMVQQVVGILRKPASKKELDKVGLAVFDIVQFEGDAVSATAKVFELLKKWLGKGTKAHVVEHKKVDSVEDVLLLFTEWVVGDGAEGIVVRHDQAGLFKIKARHNLDVAVIGFSEGTDDRKGMLHDLLVAVMRDDGSFHELTRVGGGFTDDDRKAFAKDLRKRIVPSDYVAVNNDYVAYEMVKPGTVIEISCLDMIAERARGGPVNRMVLEWDGKKYSALVRMPLVSVISPQYVRIRDDKEAVVDDVNIRQVSELVRVPEVDKSAHADDAPASEVIERTVYTKTMKGAKMVRKLMIWKTNKGDRPDFPAFVVYLTDFSPNRRTPLERDIKIASNEKTARKLFDDLAKKNFVGGWEKAA
jgi:hypothetical protein